MKELEGILKKHQQEYHPVVSFTPGKDKLCLFDGTADNKELEKSILMDTGAFTHYMEQQLANKHCRYAIGGYNENRILYRDNPIFEGIGEARTIHLGIDIWGPAGTKVYAPIGGTVHSFAYNAGAGNYGATLILQHQLNRILFHTLYGHLSKKDIASLEEGRYISRGEVIGHFGTPAENGNWAPHLHFQLIKDMRVQKGDYPGVCKPSERAQYLANCPDPDLVLNMMREVQGLEG